MYNAIFLIQLDTYILILFIYVICIYGTFTKLTNTKNIKYLYNGKQLVK